MNIELPDEIEVGFGIYLNVLHIRQSRGDVLEKDPGSSARSAESR